jgi:spore coat protein U-like protein
MTTRFSKLAMALALCSAGAVIALPASAADTKDLNVTASVTGTCKFKTATAETLAFGALDPSVGTNVNASANVLYWCTKGVTTATVAMGNGLSYDGNKRNMKDAVSGDVIPYTLSVTLSGTPGGPTVDLAAAISGQVLGTDYTGKAAGDYSDAVVLTLNP